MCGIADGRLQCRLLAEPNLTFQKALELSQAQELAEQGAQHLQQGHVPTSVHSMIKSRSLKSKKPQGNLTQPSTVCYRCRGAHPQAECRFKDAVCQACSKKGHIVRVCQSSRKPSSITNRSKGSKPTHQVTETTELDSEHYVSTEHNSYDMFTLQGSPTKPFLITVQICGARTQMEVDTGASMSIISQKTYHSLWKPQDRPLLQHSKVKLRTYTKESISVLGSIPVTVVYQDQIENLNLYTTELESHAPCWPAHNY